MNRYVSIKIGDTAEITHQITQTDLNRFVKLTGDDNKLHVDKEYALKTPYKKPVVHGMLSSSFISTVIGTKLPGDGAMWYSQNLEFHRPVRVGDTITVKAEVVKKIERNKTIEMSIEIVNQNFQKVVSGNVGVKVINAEKLIKKRKNKTDVKGTALIIGATGDIGKAICIQLAKDGFDLAINYFKSEEKALEIYDQIGNLKRKGVVIRANIVDPRQVEEMTEKVIRKFDTITVVVNCASPTVPSIKFHNLDYQSIQTQLDVNIKGMFNVLKCIVPHMEKNRYGKIISLVSQYTEDPKSELCHYITAKSGLIGLCKAMAVELAPKGIRLNMVSPGMTDTELIADVPEKVRLLTAAQTPLKRIALPEDIAGVVSFLASEKSDYLTGETIRVNGGQVMI